MKSSLVILYHREPYDEVVENGKTVYREKKSPNGIVPTLKSFFANAESSTWVAWKQVAEDKQESFDERVTMEGWSDAPSSAAFPSPLNGSKTSTTSLLKKPSGRFCTPSPSTSPTKAQIGRTLSTLISCLPKLPPKKQPMTL
jgi:hypothetical protein